MTFEEWLPGRLGVGTDAYAKAAWDAATEEVKKDHFKIGEEVEAKWTGQADWEPCTIKAVNGRIEVGTQELVRRIPAWEPKVGEAVFVCDKNLQIHVAKVKERAIYGTCTLMFTDGEEGPWEVEDLKPFYADKIGMPWEEV